VPPYADIDPKNAQVHSLINKLNDYTTNCIISSAGGNQHITHDKPRSELDSHANMIVLGKHSFIFESTGRTCTVEPFTTDLGTAENVPIVDGAIAYECPYTHQVYILIIRNALHIPTMHHNLIPPFIMRAGGIIVNDTAKIHCNDPSTNDHCLLFPNSDLTIPLQLNGTFSYFNTRAPTVQELHDCDKIFITPDASDWNPHCTSFERNESSMLTYDGDLSSANRRNNYEMESEDLANDVFELASVTASQWNECIDINISNAHISESQTDNTFGSALSLRGEISKFSASIGSCNISSASSCPLFEGPTTSSIDKLESMLQEVIDPNEMIKVKKVISSINAGKSSGTDPKQLSKLWIVTEKLAKEALDQNTQLCRHNSDNIMSRQFSTNDRMLRYRRLQSVFYTDTMFVTPKAKSLRGFSCCQVFVSDKGFVAVYPMKSQEEFQNALHWFCKQVGVPVDLVLDAHRAQTSNATKRFCDQVGTTLRILEKGTPWANRAELYIGLLKEAVRKDMRQSNCPMVLWDHAIERRAAIHNVIPRPLFQNNGLTPHAATFGAQGDISNICIFGWYEWIYYRDHGSFPIAKEKLGRVLGPIRNEGNEMAQAVLTARGTIVPRRTLRKITKSELHNSSEKRKRNIFDDLIRKKLGDSMSLPSKPLPDTSYIPYSDNCEPDLIDIPDNNDPVDSSGVAIFDKPITDRLIHAELNLPQGENLRTAKVIGRSKTDDGEYIGTYDDNPLLNSMTYDVEFSDGEIREYSANIIAENMYSQVDANGHVHSLLDSIIDHSKDEKAIDKDDMYTTTKSGQRRIRKSTQGWKLLVLWKDGSEQWIPLKILKESHPVEVAEFAVSRGIDAEPAFCWWTPYTLRKRDRIISAVKSRIAKTSHKYGVEIPNNIEHAFLLDKQNGNTFWRDSINKEMENLKVAFDILPEGKNAPPGYSKASGHIIFDVRMTLERKARWVKDGHKTPEPGWSTFAGVVSRESVRIALTYAALNALPVCGCDIQNAYLQAPSSEKHFIICGPEFGLENVGRKAIIVRALYGGKSAGADYWRHVRHAMHEMGFESCKADPDVWFRPGTRDDGTKYWQYALLYVDDILAIMEEPEKFLREELGVRFTIKEKSIGPPTQYLGNKVSEVTMENGVKCWSFSSSQYVQNAVKNVESYLLKQGEKPLPKSKSPWPSNYRPEIDVTPELSSVYASYYQSLIGILRWIVELGRGDICMETSAMASMMALPREGHLNTLFHMFSFLKTKHNAVMVFDPTVPEIDESQFPIQDWSATSYGTCVEDIPPNAPEPRGIGFTMRAFVDSDHAGDSITRRSRTGFIVFLNSAPIHWFSKKQTSIETSSFGSEFIAMKQCCEYIRGLRYKLRMMGIPVELPSYIFGDNQSVLSNTTIPHSTLKKKSSSIAFHFVREGVARSEWLTTYMNTDHNPSDMCTKSLPGGEKRTRFTSYLLHYVD
jgi:hypothetical protein